MEAVLATDGKVAHGLSAADASAIMVEAERAAKNIASEILLMGVASKTKQKQGCKGLVFILGNARHSRVGFAARSGTNRRRSGFRARHVWALRAAHA